MDTLIIVIAGFIGGALNAIAGGGSFVTLPALIMIGVPPVSANATGTVALLPGYIASAWRYRRDLAQPGGLSLKLCLILSIVGGSVGALVLQMTNEKLFDAIIPWLLLFATIVFGLGSKLINKSAHRGKNHSATLASIIILFVCIYGGYFNGGLGIVLLAVLSFLGFSSFQAMNGLKSVILAVLTTFACIVYFYSGIVNTKFLLTLTVSAVLGGYIGASLSYKLSARTIKMIVTSVGVVMTIYFFTYG